MQLLRVGAAVLNQTPLDWDHNQANIRGAIADAKARGVGLLCLPELCITGYGCEDAFFSAGLRRTARQVLHELLPETQGIAVSLGLPVMLKSGLYNAACLVADGKIVGFFAKQHLAGDGLHYEPRWFKPWPSDLRTTIELDGESYPIGEHVFEVGAVKVGFEICEDAWVGQRPGADMAKLGADVILNPSASHFAFGKSATRERFVLEGSRAFGVSYVYANLVGNEAGRAVYDGDALIASAGRLLATGPRFSYQPFHVTTAVIDLDATRMQRAQQVSYRPDIADTAGVIKAPMTFPPATLEPPTIQRHRWEHTEPGEPLDREAFSRAIPLALFDYMRKSRSRGFIVSLSGGADSAATATLVALMVRMAVRELGVDAFKDRLSYMKLDGDTAEALIPQLLTTVYQSTHNSGDVTRNAAQALADALGSTHMVFDVDAQVQGYRAMVEQGIGRELSWEQDDIALQNIQARVRAPSVWMLANIKGALLLSTSNRSEAAVGYATMDGDTSGGLSPIAGIDKHFLRQWLRWMETTGPRIGLSDTSGVRDVGETGEAGDDERWAIPALNAINEQQPTAELRPQEQGQTDEADLMPYDLLDAVEALAIGKKQSPIEVYQQIKLAFPQYEAAQLVAWIERFFRLWSRNQWKRERYAPAFHVDDLSLDPKTWCRFPILSGGFERELRELRAML